jgi:MFS family permease
MTAVEVVGRRTRTPVHRWGTPPGDRFDPVHAASTLLVVPQFVTTGFALEYLVTQRGWTIIAAGRVLAGANFVGALTRVAAGIWSDRVHSRLGPMRQLAMAITVVVGLTAIGAAAHSTLSDLALLAAVAVSVSTNGLAFTAVAERAGVSWAGRALGVQNTAQNIAAAATQPVCAELIGVAGYPASFGITAIFPLVAALTVPRRADAPATGATAIPADAATVACPPAR